jgi:hypothetical protein
VFKWRIKVWSTLFKVPSILEILEIPQVFPVNHRYFGFSFIPTIISSINNGDRSNRQTGDDKRPTIVFLKSKQVLFNSEASIDLKPIHRPLGPPATTFKYFIYFFSFLRIGTQSFTRHSLKTMNHIAGNSQPLEAAEQAHPQVRHV